MHGIVVYKSGLAFNQSKLLCIPVYKSAGSFETGESQIPDLPYSQQRRDNNTWPCPQYYKQDSPFGPATTIRRYINTYGSSDCGEPVSNSHSSHPGGIRYCWATYNVSHLNYIEPPVI